MIDYKVMRSLLIRTISFVGIFLLGGQVITTASPVIPSRLSSWIPSWSPTSYFVGKWNPVFPPSMTLVKDMVITIDENETMVVDYKGSIIKAKWKLFPNIHNRQKHYHRMLIHQIEFVRPPYLQFLRDVTKHMKLGSVFQRFGIYIDFPIIPLNMLLPLPSTLHGLKEDDMWVIDMVEYSKDEMMMGGDWKSGESHHGKIYFLRIN